MRTKATESKKTYMNQDLQYTRTDITDTTKPYHQIQSQSWRYDWYNNRNNPTKPSPNKTEITNGDQRLGNGTTNHSYTHDNQ